MHDAATLTQDRTETLATQAAAGSSESLSELYETYLDSTYRWAHARTVDHATAEDITAEVWQRVVRGIHSFVSRGPGSFVKWLFTITKRILIDHFRLRGRRREQLTADMLDLDTVDPDSTADEIAERRELAEKIARALRRLPARQAECVKLRFYLGLSLAETAAVLEIDTNAVKQLQHRALGKLRAFMPTGGDSNLVLALDVSCSVDTSDHAPTA